MSLPPGAVRMLLGAILIVAVSLLIKSHEQVGGGFSGGAVMGLGALLLYFGVGREAARRVPGIRQAHAITLAGVLLVLCTAFVPMLVGAPLLTHFPRPGATLSKLGTLSFHTSVLFELGVFLIVGGFSVCVLDALTDAERSPDVRERP